MPMGICKIDNPRCVYAICYIGHTMVSSAYSPCGLLRCSSMTDGQCETPWQVGRATGTATHTFLYHVPNNLISSNLHARGCCVEQKKLHMTTVIIRGCAAGVCIERFIMKYNPNAKEQIYTGQREIREEFEKLGINPNKIVFKTIKL